MEEIITLDYGSGGLKTSELIEDLLLPSFGNTALNTLGDGAVLNGSGDIVFSTDSFVVTPWEFPGGNIGKLSVCGTVNDICVSGGIPKYLSLSFIIEEGFPVPDLKRIISSISEEAKKAGVMIVTGDTKVVERGKGDGIYINTSGIGFLRKEVPGADSIQEGDRIIVSGSIGCHGAAVMLSRAGLNEDGAVRSDCASLDLLAESVLNAGEVRVMRDPTRGGLATTLNEFTQGREICMELNEADIPVEPSVGSACGLLGLDPLYCACEGRLIAVVSPGSERSVLEALRKTPGGENAVCIGTATKNRPGKVLMKTLLGGTRILQKLSGMQLPRIC
jgi:hydrogenase expression/formation protein HypE